ncbi:hypothetical protein BDQ17DRAFT_1334599 [Cyathus striatus]|nr:hypothetical protein BDQ17DRAFT_1334599 [Cyathus striatus]
MYDAVSHPRGALSLQLASAKPFLPFLLLRSTAVTLTALTNWAGLGPTLGTALRKCLGRGSYLPFWPQEIHYAYCVEPNLSRIPGLEDATDANTRKSSVTRSELALGTLFGTLVRLIGIAWYGDHRNHCRSVICGVYGGG